MKIDHEKIGNITVMRIQENILDAHKAPEMKTALLGMVVSEGDQFVVNLKNVERMDSTGLGSLLFGIRQAEQHDKDICFCEINPGIQFLIRIARLEQVVPIFDTEKEALEDFAKENDKL